VLAITSAAQFRGTGEGKCEEEEEEEEEEEGPARTTFSCFSRALEALSAGDRIETTTCFGDDRELLPG